MIYRVTTLIQNYNINIASMTCDRSAKGKDASMSISLDSALVPEILTALENINEIYMIRSIEVTK